MSPASCWKQSTLPVSSRQKPENSSSGIPCRQNDTDTGGSRHGRDRCRRKTGTGIRPRSAERSTVSPRAADLAGHRPQSGRSGSVGRLPRGRDPRSDTGEPARCPPAGAGTAGQYPCYLRLWQNLAVRRVGGHCGQAQRGQIHSVQSPVRQPAEHCHGNCRHYAGRGGRTDPGWAM